MDAFLCVEEDSEHHHGSCCHQKPRTRIPCPWARTHHLYVTFRSFSKQIPKVATCQAAGWVLFWTSWGEKKKKASNNLTLDFISSQGNTHWYITCSLENKTMHHTFWLQRKTDPGHLGVWVSAVTVEESDSRTGFSPLFDSRTIIGN